MTSTENFLNSEKFDKSLTNIPISIDIHLLHETLQSYDEFRYSLDTLIYPYLDANILRRLKPVKYNSPRDFLAKEEKTFWNAVISYESTSDSAPYTPHLPPDELCSYFVITGTYADLNEYLELDERGKWKYGNIVYIGPKGSGKTSMQNYWLSRNHDYLENNNIFYLRCNAQVLFDAWASLKHDVPADLYPSIKDYFDFQLLAILSDHSKYNGIGRRLMARIKDSGILFRHKQSRAEDRVEYNLRGVYEYIDIHIRERLEYDENYITSTLFPDKVTKRREFFRWKECSKTTRKFLDEIGIHILFILDGVDNLHLNTEYGVAPYNRLLPELVNFVLRVGPPNELRLAVMRNRTWIDILKKDHSTTGCNSVAKPKKIIHQVPNVNEIARKRTDWLSEKMNSSPNMNNDLSLPADTIKSAVAALPSLEIMHNNIRNIIVNSATLADQVRYRWHQLGKDPSVDLSRQAQQMMKRNLFLNGDFLLQTNDTYYEKNRDKGLAYINPFWIDLRQFPQSRSKTSLLFLRIRILEILWNTTLSHESLCDTLVGGFGYDRSCVEQTLKDSRAFGWIDSIKLEQDDIVYELSATGKYLVDILLYDLDVLYMLAIDTQIPERFISDGLFLVHSNRLQRSGYIGSAAVTVITFIRHLYARCARDQKKIDFNLLDETYRKRFLSDEHILSISNSICSILNDSHVDDQEIFRKAYGNLMTEV
jgi:hypothetical protein